MDSKFWPQVLQVVPTDDFGVYAYFNDGSIRFVDVKPKIKPGTVFEPLGAISIFKEKLAVINDTVAWDMGGNRSSSECIDLDPFVIFATPAVPDPLTKKNTI